MPHAVGDLPIWFRTKQGPVRVAPRRWGSTYLDSTLPPGPAVAPRRWGSTSDTGRKAQAEPGCPTPVGIYPFQSRERGETRRLPHAGGDLPFLLFWSARTRGVAPRRWGSTGSSAMTQRWPQGCPTPVGVYPVQRRCGDNAPRLPHAGGGLPIDVFPHTCNQAVAPRRWGSTRAGAGLQEQGIIGCPTPVGIYRISWSWALPRLRLPHAGGGYPEQEQRQSNWNRLPHAGGDLPLEYSS